MSVEITPQGTPANNEEITFKELFFRIKAWTKYLISKWVLIIAFGLLGAVLGYFYAYNKKPVYTASTSFVLEANEGQSGLAQYAGIASMVGVDLAGGGGGIFEGDNIVALYKSRKMIQKALLSPVQYNNQSVLLIDLYIKINDLRKTWDTKPQLKTITFNDYANADFSKRSRVKDSLLGVFVDDINNKYLEVGKPDKKLNVITVGVKSSDEFFSKSFNEQIVRNVSDFFIETKTKKSLDNVTILSMKVDSVRAAMNGAIYNVAAISDATPNLNPTRQIQRVVPMQRSQFSAETNKEILSQLIKNLEMSKIALLKETPLIQVVDEPVFPLELHTFSKVKYGVIGFVIMAFLVTLTLTIRRFFKYLLK